MNPLYVCFARCFQGVTWVALHFLNFREPKLVEGEKAIEQIPEILRKEGRKGALIVTDDVIFKLGLTKKLEDSLKTAGIPYDVFHEVVPNPTVKNCNDALKLYKEKGFDAVIALGGGSSMDTAKAVAAMSTNPHRPVQKMRGVCKIPHKTDLVIAIPTTAGTGSEATLAAVICDPETKDKYAVEDPHIIPSYAVLEPSLLIGLPGKVTSTTGIDALCHAVESYIGGENTKKTKRVAKIAIKEIFENLEKSYKEPKNLEYRAKMQDAAYWAGVAFTRGFVGYVHSMSHALGALYNTPHGLAIAITLPYLLEAYGKNAYKKEAELADLIGVGKEGMTREEKAKAFIQAVKDLEKAIDIPNTIKGIADPKDFEVLAEHAVKEANPLYPVPKIFNKAEIIELYKKMYI